MENPQHPLAVLSVQEVAREPFTKCLRNGCKGN